MNVFINIKKLIVFTFFCLIAFWAYGQEETVKGTVLSPEGDSLKNVKITVQENPGVEEYTGSNGTFTVSATSGQHVVVEYNKKTRKILKVSEIQENGTIVLDRNSQLVDVGFNNKQRKEEVASSVGIMDSDQLEHVSAHTPGNVLFGQIPGLRVFQNTGVFPTDRQPDMDIRGQATTQNNSILVLVDGVERPLNSVVPEEIESVTVLRDAAAKAKYGQRAANGVLLINTKRGTKGKTRYNVSFEQGITQPDRVPDFLDAPAYARAVNEAMSNDGLDPRYSDRDIERFESGEYPTFWPDVDWMDQTLEDMGQFSRVNFSASGGNQDVDFYLGLNYQNNKGLYKHTESFEDFSTQLDYDKLNFRTNLDIDLTPTTFAQVNLAGYVMSHQGPKTADIVGHAFETPSAMFPVKNYDGSWGGTNRLGNNPVAELSATGYDLTHTRNYLLDLRLEQNLSSIAEGLSAELFAAFDNQANYWENKNKTFPYKEINPVVDESGAIVDTIVNELGEDTDLSPQRSEGDLQASHYDLRGKLMYNNTFGAHAINGWVMFQQEHQQVNGINQTFRYRNFVGNLHYGLSNKYFLDATVSYAGTNRIQDEEDRYGLFPAIGGSWAIGRESFMSNADFINSLRLSASHGKVGNGLITMQDLTSAKYGWVYGIILGHNYSGSGGMDQTQLPIETKKFESSVESNVGLDARLFDRLSFHGELFYTKRNDILVPSTGQYSEIIGLLPEQTPEGEVKNQGYELNLTWSKETGDFTYYISGSFSQYKNEIININEEYRPYDYMKREGESVGQHFGWESAGFYSSESDIENSATTQFGNVEPGDIKYVNQNNDGVIDEFDQVPIGNPSTPEIYYSANLGLGYKGFHISALFQGTEKSSAYLNEPHVFWPLRSNDNISTWYDNYWSQNNKSGAELPRLTTESNNNNFRKNDIWIRDNSYLKLRYAEISYSLPKNFVSDFSLQKVRIYLRGRNLFTMDDIEYVDPENPGAHYPALKVYNVGVNVTF